MEEFFLYGCLSVVVYEIRNFGIYFFRLEEKSRVWDFFLFERKIDS